MNIYSHRKFLAGGSYSTLYTTALFSGVGYLFGGAQAATLVMPDCTSKMAWLARRATHNGPFVGAFAGFILGCSIFGDYNELCNLVSNKGQFT
jgi:hypothetical protein